MDFIEACKKIISIDSTPSNGTGEVSRFIKSLAESLGFQVHLEEVVQRGIEEANVICFPKEKSSKVHLMLQTHLDTVDPGSFAHWEKTGKNPFHATIHDSKIYGLGVADTKIDFLCKLYAAKEFIGKDLKHSFAVVGTYGEEYNMNGSIRLIRHKTLLADRVLVSEPTNFDLITAGKGLANIEITIPFSKEEMEAKVAHDSGEGQSTQCKIFKGVPAHSSQPLKGVNAIEELFRYMENLPDQILLLEVDGGTNYNTIPVQSLIEFDLVTLKSMTVNQKVLKIYRKILSMKKEFENLEDPQFDPAQTTLNIGMIRTYDDHLKIMGCVRWPPIVKEDTYGEWMADLKSFCDSLGATFRVRDSKKPFSVNPKSDFSNKVFSAIYQDHEDSQISTQPVTNEANVFHKLGLEVLVFGPGQREGNSQTPHESIPIDNLYKAIKIYQNLINQLCVQ